VNVYAIPPLVTCLLALFLCVFVVSRSRTEANLTFAGVCICTAYWQGAWVLLFNVKDATFAEHVARIGYSGIIFIPFVFFHFISVFTNSCNKRILGLGYGTAIVFLIVLWSTNLFVSGTYSFFWGFYPKAGPFHPLYLFATTIILVRALWLLRKYRRQVSFQPIKVNQANYVAISTIIYSFSASDFVVNYGINYYPIGFVFTTAYTTVIAYAIIKYRLLDINVFIKKTLIYASLLVTLIIPCYALVIIAEHIRFGQIDYAFSIGLLALFILVGFLFPKLRFQTEEALERVLFKKRVDYRDTLLRSSRDMVSIVDIRALSDNLVQTVGRSLGIKKVSLLLANDLKGNYHLEASIGLELKQPDRVLLPTEGPLIKLLQHRREPIVKEELEWIPVGPETPQTIQTMSELGAEISLPIISKEKLIGILNLGNKADKTLYSNDELELLSTLANQAAIAIENARLYENLKQSQDTLRRADRLSSLGLLTAGLAHEIRNPLVAIRTFTQLLPERYDDAEFREGFQGLALKEVDRICGLINDLLSFARPSKPNVALENVNDVVDNIVRILETQAKEKGTAIMREFNDSLPKVWIDREQMKQVFMNLILNAIQAMKEGGSISIATRAISRIGTEPSGEFVQVEVRDTGIGIPEENLQHIFDPFFTSKDEGSGLGLAVSHQIVQEHGGFVTVESTVGKGTSFFVHVPVGKPVRPVTNGHAHVNETHLSH
jgi:signal transduction histidine kinase